MGTLSIGIIILEDYIVNLLVGIIRAGKYNKLTKYVNKVGLKQVIISTGYKRSFKYYKLINK